MHFCNQCGKIIPNWVKIDDILHNISNRTKCLQCLQFKSKKQMSREVTCKLCGRRYLYSRSDRKGASATTCNSCHCKIKKFKSKNEILNIFGRKCTNCGYDKCVNALAFHHVGRKKFELSEKYGRTKISSLIREASKCILLCANCHAILYKAKRKKVIANGCCKIHGSTKILIDGRCNKCRNNAVNKRRRKIKLMAVEYMGGKCEICGYDKNVRALEFHHVTNKKFKISSYGKKWELVRNELKKCRLLCKNCHIALHHGDSGRI